MNVQKNVSLKPYNTFKVESKAKFFCEVNSLEDLKDILSDPLYKQERKLILGSGANILFVDDFDGLVIKVNIKGREVIKEDNENIWLKIGAGEDWEELVEYVVDNNWSGIENLAMIPSSFGGAVVQNVAAYGQNLKDVVEEVMALNQTDLNLEKFKNKDCHFEYHGSLFKKKKNYIVTSAIIKLNKNQNLETSYNSRNTNRDSILDELEKFASKPYSTKDIFTAVSRIRARKLPDIHGKDVGCAGSIF